MDKTKSTQDNRAKQQNPNHQPTGPGRDAGYPGRGDQADLKNHGNQMNPNNAAYEASRQGTQGGNGNQQGKK